MNTLVRKPVGFTLVETLVVLALSSMIMIAILGIYQQVRAGAVAITGQLEKNRLNAEILQKIAEDIDRLAAPGFEATINFRNKLDSGYRSAQLILESSFYGNNNRKMTYERIVWQTSYDAFSDSMILYRLHDGINVEDKIIEKTPDESSGAGLFIPVASGVTYFECKAQQGEDVLGAWTAAALPKAVRIGLSFEFPRQLEDGTVGVPEEAVSFRTIAVDRTRMIAYNFVKKKFDIPEDPNETPEDPNRPAIENKAAPDQPPQEGK
ncbi:MAG: prepilin-type N-terminal cleavage/methylation domain-containing protein [Planctomycetaceae bacterium]|nr:prepilin-type N-terminal cleavage/methylation domain-containing protein [Planctomycetaceae bacterium]